MQNSLGKFQCLQSHKLEFDKVKNGVPFTLSSPPSHCHPFQNLQPHRYCNLMAPPPTLVLFFQVRPRCVALPVCFLFTTVSFVLTLTFLARIAFHHHTHAPPFHHAILLASWTSPSSHLPSWHPLCCAMNISYSLHLTCHYKWEVLYVRTPNHFIPAIPILMPWVGLSCIVYNLQCYGWRRGEEGWGAEIGHLLAGCTLLSSHIQYMMSLFFWVYLHHYIDLWPL